MPLWTVLVRYATKIEPGIIEVEYDVDDLEDIMTIVDQGPGGFTSIAYIHVRRGDTIRYPIIPIEGGEAIPEELISKLDKEPEGS